VPVARARGDSPGLVLVNGNMNFIRKFLKGEDAEALPSPKPIDVRPLAPIGAPTGRASDIATVMASPEYAEIRTYFSTYPGRSFMSDHSRAVLYSLVRMMRPQLVAEIGTLHAGTTEVFARALWENGGGVVHTADPYGADRCPAIIAQWPAELQRYVQFHAKSSMDFFSRMVLESKTFDLVLIDGNHDYEYALFDLQMAARLLRPGGLVVMDNAEQSGPFKAARLFLAANPAWREIGNAVASYDPFEPFERERASLPTTGFLLLHAPEYLSIGEGPHSWGQAWIDTPQLRGLRFRIVQQCRGTLFYQIYLRGFANENRWVKEERIEGSVRIEADGGDSSIDHLLERTLSVESPPEYDDQLFTLELDLSWHADSGSAPLALAALPAPI
jgi:predicted O-methyltransferase YrrM